MASKGIDSAAFEKGSASNLHDRESGSGDFKPYSTQELVSDQCMGDVESLLNKFIS